ncbi:hypothetical protein RI367_000121 [Sorochytrium milnesiophthora]
MKKTRQQQQQQQQRSRKQVDAAVPKKPARTKQAASASTAPNTAATSSTSSKQQQQSLRTPQQATAARTGSNDSITATRSSRRLARKQPETTPTRADTTTSVQDDDDDNADDGDSESQVDSNAAASPKKVTKEDVLVTPRRSTRLMATRAQSNNDSDEDADQEQQRKHPARISSLPAQTSEQGSPPPRKGRSLPTKTSVEEARPLRSSSLAPIETAPTDDGAKADDRSPPATPKTAPVFELVIPTPSKPPSAAASVTEHASDEGEADVSASPAPSSPVSGTSSVATSPVQAVQPPPASVPPDFSFPLGSVGLLGQPTHSSGLWSSVSHDEQDGEDDAGLFDTSASLDCPLGSVSFELHQARSLSRSVSQNDLPPMSLFSNDSPPRNHPTLSAPTLPHSESIGSLTYTASAESLSLSPRPQKRVVIVEEPPVFAIPRLTPLDISQWASLRTLAQEDEQIENTTSQVEERSSEPPTDDPPLVGHKRARSPEPHAPEQGDPPVKKTRSIETSSSQTFLFHHSDQTAAPLSWFEAADTQALATARFAFAQFDTWPAQPPSPVAATHLEPEKDQPSERCAVGPGIVPVFDAVQVATPAFRDTDSLQLGSDTTVDAFPDPDTSDDRSTRSVGTPDASFTADEFRYDSDAERASASEQQDGEEDEFMEIEVVPQRRQRSSADLDVMDWSDDEQQQGQEADVGEPLSVANALQGPTGMAVMMEDNRHDYESWSDASDYRDETPVAQEYDVNSNSSTPSHAVVDVEDSSEDGLDHNTSANVLSDAESYADEANTSPANRADSPVLSPSPPPPPRPIAGTIGAVLLDLIDHVDLATPAPHSDLSVKYTLSMPRREQQHQVFARSIDASPVEECGVPTTVPLQRRDGDLEFEGTLSDRDAILAQGFDIIHEQYGEPFHRLRKRSSGLTQYISSFNTYIVWTLNPDEDGSFGVDLNRNYPTGWRLPCGGDLEPRSNAYRGQRAASESETQTMLLLQAQIRPYKMLDLHSHGREVRIPYAAECMHLPPQVSAAFESAGKALAARMSSGAVQYTQTRSCCVGGNIHDAVNKYATLAMLVETGTSFQPPKPDLDIEKALVWSGIQAWLLYRARVEGVVTDSQTGTPVAATINVAPVIFAFDEQNQAAPDTGLFHLWLAPGNYSLTFSAPHYLPLLLTVTVGDFGVGGAHLQLNMQRTN